jgi:hypothetical protein
MGHRRHASIGTRGNSTNTPCFRCTIRMQTLFHPEIPVGGVRGIEQVDILWDATDTQVSAPETTQPPHRVSSVIHRYSG